MTFHELINYLSNHYEKYQENYSWLFFLLIKHHSKKIKDKTDLITNRDQLIDFDFDLFINDCNKVYKDKYPVEYITQEIEINDLNLFVDENVLIPRHDTNTVINNFLEVINSRNDIKNVLDICAGSGLIALTIKNRNDKYEVYGSDISKSAVKIANFNAVKNLLNVKFYVADYLEILNKLPEEIDAIIINPPYLDEELKTNYIKEISYEPFNALFAKNNGTFFYEEIFKYITTNKNNIKVLCMEFSELIFDKTSDLLKKYNLYEKTSFFRDDNNKLRGFIIQWKS
ncbi:peptide chain release factor N(5)-glutamine methyltransferase [Mycoplasma bradburyae]|uniref:peptide chain release factor N(5)-glutamine methyltransferase n=1 Tax=Mycoplasma bradburyae TaxID=2963128 RepID=A0AAW6HPS7_9MOLU|nr:peptide chain release factor N(5)-glutamine methyltransferase [Mycoplasma bradburyae]MDC4183631.1 class I SAM-dependent methyltransferase [Mycoplasma bradburyae]UTS70972.1 class I SAM-dependent methyltransferase [Mycoplasma bradburyae]